MTVICNYAGKVRAEGKEQVSGKSVTSPISRPNLELMRRSDTVETPKSEKEKLDLINGTIRYLSKDRGCKKVGAVGFCNGAAWVIRALSNNPGVARVDTGFVAHPANVTANLLQGVQGPLSVASADDDAIQTQDRRFQSENILKQNGWPYKISLYSHLRHGFAVRRAVLTKAEVYAKK